MPSRGDIYTGMHTEISRADTATVNSVAAELRTIGTTANQTAADVGLATNGGALLNIADDIGATGGMVIRSADLADGYSILPNGDVRLPDGTIAKGNFVPPTPTNGSPSTPALRSLIKNIDGTVTHRTEAAVVLKLNVIKGASVDFYATEVEGTLWLETQEVDGYPTVAEVGFDFAATQEFPPGFSASLMAFDAAGGDVTGTIGFGTHTKYELPPGVGHSELDAIVFDGPEQFAADYFGAEHAESSLPLLAKPVIEELGEPIGGGRRVYGGPGLGFDTTSWSSEAFPDAGSASIAEAITPRAGFDTDLVLSSETEWWNDGSEATTRELEIAGAIYGSAIVRGNADASLAFRHTALTTGDGAEFSEHATIVSQGHASGEGAAMPAGPVWGRRYRESSGDALGDRIHATTCDSGDVPRMCTSTSAKVTGNTDVSGTELGYGNRVEVGFEKTTEMTTAEVTRQHTYEDRGWNPYDLPDREPPDYWGPTWGPRPDDGPTAEPLEEPVEATKVYLPFVGNEPIPGPDPEPQYEPIKDWPPVESEPRGHYLQEPELIQNPPSGPETYVVQEGDNFWYIAEDQLAGANGGDGPSQEEFLEYWNELQAMNAGELRFEGNPDLIFEGQEFELPSEPEIPTYHVKPQ